MDPDRDGEADAVSDALADTPGLRYGTPQAWWTITAVVLGSGIVFLDGTVVNVVLPAISEDLGTTLGGMQQTVNAYLVTLSLEDGDAPVVAEGTVALHHEKRPSPVVEAFQAKYGWDVTVDVDDGIGAVTLLEFRPHR